MAVRSEREKLKMQEKYQITLAQMLKEEDNKYCVDCDTKSPRWASWNIGVFICIRCAGFHRNLGVHISKVKSVNLDSWTPEQIAAMQAMGNSRARAVYEANLPDGFRRPQADSALESFIRAKYEQRKWIAKEWIPPEMTVPIDNIEAETNQRRDETTPEIERVEKNGNTKVPKLKPFAMPLSTTNPVRQTVQSSPTTSTAEINTQNLLSLDEPSLSVSNNTTTAINTSSSNNLDPLHELFETTSQETEVNSFEKELQNAFTSSNDTPTNTNGVMSNEKIMALFNISQTATASVTNVRPLAAMQPPNLTSPGFTYPPVQHPHISPHQKSASLGNNLYQQGTNFGSHGNFQTQVSYPLPTRPGSSTINHNNLNGISAPTLQNPVSTFTQEQLNTQFSQLMSFGNTKSNTTASALISSMPMRPVTEYMPASSDSLWQQ